MTDIQISSLTPCVRIFASELNRPVKIISKSHQIEAITAYNTKFSIIYFCGVLTEIFREQYGPHKGQIIIRVADPTGAININTTPKTSTGLLEFSPPSFISFTAKISGVESDGIPILYGDNFKLSNRNERDNWIINTGTLLAERLERKDENIDDINHDLCRDLIKEALIALNQVKDIPVSPEEIMSTILSLIKDLSGPRGCLAQDVIEEAKRQGIKDNICMDIIRKLIEEDEIYQPSSGFVKIL